MRTGREAGGARAGRFGAGAVPVRDPAERDADRERRERLALVTRRPRPGVRAALAGGALLALIAAVALLLDARPW